MKSRSQLLVACIARVVISCAPALSLANGINPPENKTTQNVRATCVTRDGAEETALFRATLVDEKRFPLLWQGAEGEQSISVGSLTKIDVLEEKPRGGFAKARLTTTEGEVREGDLQVARHGRSRMIQGYRENDPHLDSFAMANCKSMTFTMTKVIDKHRPAVKA